MTSHNGSINTTVGNLSQEVQISPSDDVAIVETSSAEEIALFFQNESANLESYADGGTGGNVILRADGDITTSHISTFGPEVSGKIELTSHNGAINTGSLVSFSQAGYAGDVTLTAANDVNIDRIGAAGNLQGGNITIDTGEFKNGIATIHSFSEHGNAGNVKITSTGDTILGGDANRHAIRSAGLHQGGNINIRSFAEVFHFTPKHCSWLNQIQIWFSILVRKLLRRASFTSQAELKTRILEKIDYFNRTMTKLFQWTYKGKALTA